MSCPPTLAAVVLQEIADHDVLAFVEYDNTPRIRVRQRIGRGSPWHCEVHGQQTRPSCEHTRAVRDALRQHDRLR